MQEKLEKKGLVIEKSLRQFSKIFSISLYVKSQTARINGTLISTLIMSSKSDIICTYVMSFPLDSWWLNTKH